MIIENIIKLCKQNSTTITALEAELGFGRCTISKWKSSSPSVENLKKVADRFGVPVDYFLNDTTSGVQ